MRVVVVEKGGSRSARTFVNELQRQEESPPSILWWLERRSLGGIQRVAWAWGRVAMAGIIQ